MGSLKKYYLEDQEARYTQLAEALGISWNELLSLEYDISANMSKDGFIYGYTLSFCSENDRNVLSKIQGLGNDLTIDIEPWVLERNQGEDYELSAIFENQDYLENFLAEIESLDKLLGIYVENEQLKNILLRQLFIGVIGAVETYLSDAFINTTLSSEHYLQNFIESHPEFKKTKISLSEFFTVSKSINEKAKATMVGAIYHRLPIVQQMYKQTFHIEFPDISQMQKYISLRHDLVHRNGKTIDGEKVDISEQVFLELKKCAISFITDVSKSFEFDDDLPF